MFKRAAVAVFALAATVNAPVAAADPSFAPPRPPGPGEGGINIPGMDFSAQRGQPCSGKSFFGRGPRGETLACVFVDDADTKREWVRSAPLAGVRTPGSSCDSESDYVAMSPNGKGMTCGTQDFDPSRSERTHVWMIGS